MKPITSSQRATQPIHVETRSRVDTWLEPTTQVSASRSRLKKHRPVDLSHVKSSIDTWNEQYQPSPSQPPSVNPVMLVDLSFKPLSYGLDQHIDLQFEISHRHVEHLLCTLLRFLSFLTREISSVCRIPRWRKRRIRLLFVRFMSMPNPRLILGSQM